MRLITFYIKELNYNPREPTTENVHELIRTGSILEDQRNAEVIENQTFYNMVSPIFSNLLSGVEKISNELQNLEEVNAALDLIEEIMILMRNHNIQNQYNLDTVNEAVQNFNKFYIKMCNSKETSPNRKNHLYNTMKKASYILYEVQRYADPASLEVMPDWLHKIIQCSSSKQRGQTLVLISVGVFIKVIENT